jgi:hypothetical protein
MGRNGHAASRQATSNAPFRPSKPNLRPGDNQPPLHDGATSMGWTFQSAEGSTQNRRRDNEHIASHIKHLEHREAEILRRLETLNERHAFFPNEVSDRQVRELTTKLENVRGELDLARSVTLQPDRA